MVPPGHGGISSSVNSGVFKKNLAMSRSKSSRSNSGNQPSMLHDAPDMLYYYIYIYYYINVMEHIEKDRKRLAGFKTIETK